MGVISIMLAIVIAVAAAFSHGSWIVVVVALLFGAAAYAALVRPRVGLTSDSLVMRHMLTTQEVPLASITSVSIARTLVVRTDSGARFVSPALSRSLRRSLRPTQHDPLKNYADLVEDKIQHAVDNARARE